MSTRIYNTRSNANAAAKVVAQPSRTRRALGDITNAARKHSAIQGKKPAVPSLRVTRTSTSSGASSARSAITSRSIQNTEKKSTIPQTARPLITTESAVRDIDAPHSGNAQYCTAYVNDIQAYYKSLEATFTPNHGYMAKQKDINEKMRGILIDWLIEVHLKFKLKTETLYLTVTIIDRYLEKRQVNRDRLQLVGVTALLLASKYEEIYPPELQDLVYVTDRAYSESQILSMESSMLNVLQFRLSGPTVYRFLPRALRAAGASNEVVFTAQYCAEKALVDFTMVQFPPSVIAAASVLLALRNEGLAWTPTLQHYSFYSEEELEPAASQLAAVMRRAGRSSLQAVRKKYREAKFLSVADKIRL